MAEQNTEIAKLNNNLREYKQKYLDMKKRELRTNESHMHNPLLKPVQKAGPKFAGGGFNLKSYKIA